MKIAVIGYSGSGKSTLSKHLSNMYNIPVLYLDTVQFIANWELRNLDEGLSIVSEFMKQESWVIDGNYTKFQQSERLEQADQIIFMNFSRINCLYRAVKRYFKYKNTSRESAALGCNEKIDLEFILWILYKGRTENIRNNYKNILNNYKYKSIIIKNQKQLDEFMKAI